MAAPPETTGCGIAVVGLACRFPGANTPDEFWANLVGGREARVTLSDDELRAAGVRESLIADPAYVKSTMPLAGVDQFDAGFFGFSPRDAAILDPQHRHFLECCWEALEHAGYDPGRFDGSIGVFGGSGHNAYLHLNLLGNQALEEQVGHFLLRHTGNDKDFLATRVSYAMNLRGPSVNVQTACSTSLVAVHLAVSSLLSLECDIALAGGVTIEMPTGQGYLFRDGEILSPDGHCRPFDQSAGGTVFGSGVGLVVLRRLDDALAAGDTIHAVILGSAVNNDGAAKTSYLAPSVDGQAAAIREALVVADVDPATVTFIECHGTGTKLGDAIEIAALRQAYGSSVGGGECVLGSVKSNIGHLDTAAGVAGLIKTILAMRHRIIPGTLHYRAPNEHVAAHAPPFVVRRDSARWEQPERMRAGVNSLGVGGTNAHVLLESPPAPARTADDREPQLLPVSARSAAALRRRIEDVRDALAGTTHALPDIAWTLQQGRHHFEHRAVVAATGTAGAQAALAELAAHDGDLGAKALPDANGVSMLFAGGGAGHAGMGRDLYETEPAYRKAIDRVCAIARDGGLLDYDLRRLLTDRDSPDAAQMERPTRGLPALFATQYACAQLWESMGVIPTAVIGHSVGEYAAACVAGVLSVDDALRIVVRRAQLFETLLPGSMLSVLASEDEVRPLLPPAVTVAAVNAPNLTVVSGPVADVNEMENVLAARGIESQRVPIGVAAHSPMLQPILAEFRVALSRLRFRAPQLRIASNLTGEWLTAAQATDPGYWLRQLREPVRFAEGFALVAQEAHVHIEVGPGTVLSSLARQQPAAAGHRVVSSMRHPREAANDRVRFHEAFGALWKAGVDVDWNLVHDAGARRRVPLPTYPFEHQRHWFDAPGIAAGAASGLVANSHTAARTPDEWCQQEVWEPRPFAPSVPAGLHGLLVIGDDIGDDADGLGGADARLRGDVDFIHADSSDQAALRDTLRSLPHDRHWTVVSIVDSGDDSPAALERALLSLKRQAETFIDVAPEVVGWRIVVHGAAPFTDANGLRRVSPVAKAVVAAARVLRSELDIEVRALDCSPSALGHEQALAELLGGTDDVVALRGHERLVPQHRALPLPPFTASPSQHDGCAVITGGLGDLALAIASDLVGDGWTRIALLARRALPAGDEAHLGFHESSGSRSAARIRQLDALRARGAEVRVWEVDVADAVALRTTWAQVEAAMGAVRLTLHAAGDLRDSLVGAKSDGDLRRVVAPKAAAFTLTQLTSAPLVLFSSTSAGAGIAGQFDYAAANAYMDALAELARADGRPVLSLGWGVFRETGMAARLAAPPRPSAIPPGTATRRHRNNAYERVITAADWVVAEHRTKGGTAILPGTALLALLVESLNDEHAVLADVSLLQPLVFEPQSRRVVQVVREGDRLTLRSALDADAAERDEWLADHVEARVARAGEGSAPRQLRRAAIEARCRSVRAFTGRAVDHAQMDFGPRWACVDSVRYGDGEALVSLSLDPSYWHDLSAWPLHPALLDMATGAAQELLPAVDLTRDFFVPQAYRTVRILSPLAPVVVSHVRRTASTPDHCEFDIVVADESGRVLVVVEGFRLRRMPATVLDALGAARQARELPPAFLEGLARGIATADAAPLMMRLVSQLRAGAVTVSPVAIDELRLQRQPRDGSVEAVASDVTRHHAVVTGAPATAREQALARIWEEALGIDAVGVGDNFFELGGHSLLLTRVATRARKQLGITLPLARLFDVPTIAGWLAEPGRHDAPPAGDWTTLKRAPREAFVAPDEPAPVAKGRDVAV